MAKPRCSIGQSVGQVRANDRGKSPQRVAGIADAGRTPAGRCVASILAMAIALGSGEAYAQASSASPEVEDRLGSDIVVTARRREEILQDVPVAVTAVTADELRQKSVKTAYDLMSTVPGLNVTGSGTTSNAPTFVVRGQGVGIGSLPSTVQYFAEVPLAEQGRSGGLNNSYFDLESIQVLKGPQGTLFGRSSTGGAILFTPRRPGPDFDGYVDISYGNYNAMVLTGAVNVPIGEHVSIRVAANLDRNDGFAKSTITGQRLNDRDRFVLRVGVLVEPTDWLSNYLLFQDARADENGDAWTIFAVNPNLPNLNTGPTGAGRATITAVCGGAAQTACIDQRIALIDNLRNTWLAELNRLQTGGKKAYRRSPVSVPLFFRNRNQIAINNTEISFGGSGLFSDLKLKNIFSLSRILYTSSVAQLYPPTGTVYYQLNFNRSTQQYYDDNRGKSKWGDTFTEEVQLSGKINELHDFTLGYSLERTNKDSGLALPTLITTFAGAFSNPLGTPTASGGYLKPFYVKQGGFFGQATLDFADFGLDGVKFTGGYRRSFFDTLVTSTRAVFTNTAVVPAPAPDITGEYHEKEDSYSLTLEYKPVSTVLLYAAHRRGFKSGGINTGALPFPNNPDATPSFLPEIVNDFELGAKTEWTLGGVRGLFNIAAYYAKLTDQQVGGSFFNGASIIQKTTNAGKSRYQGIEVESSVLFTPELRFDLNYAFFDGKYLEFPGTVTNLLGQQIPRVNQPIFNMPKHKLDVTSSYTLPVPEEIGEVSFTANMSYQSKVIMSESVLIDPNYKVQKGYALVNLRLAWDNVFGNPVDLAFWVRNLTNKLYRTTDSGGLLTLGVNTALIGAPRTFGVQLRARFGRSAE